MVAPDMAAMDIKRHHCLLAPLLMLLACAPGPERVIERRIDAAPAARGLGLLRTAMLDGHNRARHAVSVAPLAWDDRLAADARAYAESMARSGRFQHAEQPAGAGREGENLWVGTRYAYGYGEMVSAWVAERRDFVDGIAPDFSRTGRWQDVGHYTQIIWPRTTRVGCAVASSKSQDYLVCRYSPPGNVVGERVL